MNILLIVVIAALLVYGLMRAGVGGKGAAATAAEGEAFLAENRDKHGVTETSSGLQYEVLKQGHGDRHPTASDKVLVHYHGTLLNGNVFDSSVKRGEPIAFGLNQVIPGWTEGVQLMTVGEKTRFYVPANLAYGSRRVGDIPAGSLLIFDVELLEIQS